MPWMHLPKVMDVLQMKSMIIEYNTGWLGFPMVRKTEIHLAVKTFAKEIRVSAYLILGPVGTHKGVELRKVANEINYVR